MSSLVRSLAVALAAAVVAVGAGVSQAEEIPFDEVRILIEVNATDGDAGIQVFLDGEPWSQVRVVGPDGRKLVDLRGKGTLKQLGLSELFFESEEPSFDEVPLDELLAMFPEGDYQVSGKTVEGDTLTGSATLTHAIPDGPVVVSPGEGETVDPSDAVIDWDPVADPPGSQIVGYQVIVEGEEPLGVFQVGLPATTTSVTIPPEFFRPEITEYEFEILAIEASGNQTITEQAFEIE